MAGTLVIDQKGNRLGYMRGFKNYAQAFVDDNDVPWLPIDGYAFYRMAQQMAQQANTIFELEQELNKLKTANE